MIEEELVPEEQEGPAVTDKLSKIAKSRFRVNKPESKLRDKMSNYPILQNCSELKAPTLCEELTDKGYLYRHARKNDTRVLNVQRMVSCAAAAVISAADKLHTLASELAAHIGVGHTARADNVRTLTTANEVLAIQGDVIAI